MHAYHSYAWDRTLIQSWTLVKSKTRTEGVTEGADHIIICTPFPLLQLGAGGCDSSRGGQGGDSVETNCWPARFGHAHHWRGWRPYWFSPFSSVRHFLNWHSIRRVSETHLEALEMLFDMCLCAPWAQTSSERPLDFVFRSGPVTHIICNAPKKER